jgi:hypothetical protein
MLTVRPQARSATLRRLGGLLGAAALFLAIAAPTAAAPKPFVIDLGRRADFVAQTNNVQCVGASMQMMLNMVRPGTDRSAKTQARLQQLARAWSPERPDGRERRGASVVGWAAGLTVLGAGPYEVAGYSTIEEATLAAARAIRTTGRPVGLLVWRGRHAWVMSGFTATGDPLATAARVTSVIVEDPLYPAVSRAWGASPAPGSSLSLSELGRQFVPRTSSWWGSFGGEFVIVRPVVFDPRVRRLLGSPGTTRLRA